MMSRRTVLLLIIATFGAVLLIAQGKSSKTYPVVLHAEVPVYPLLAKTARVSGVVVVRVTVSDGAVTGTQVLKSDAPLLVDNTVKNIRTWQFSPSTNVIFESTFTYNLETEEVSDPENPVVELHLPQAVRVTVHPTKLPCHDCGPGAEVIGKPI